MSTGGAANVGCVIFTSALALTVAGAFVNFAVLVRSYVFVCDGAEPLRILCKVSFGLCMLEIKERVVLILGGILIFRLGLSHGRGTSRNVDSWNRMVRRGTTQG